MEIFEPAFDYVSPGIEINSKKFGELVLTHYNARIRLFTPPNEMFNHIEFVTTEEKLVAFQPDQETLDKFIEMAFPSLLMPYVDAATFNWLADTMGDGLGQVTDLHDLGMDYDSPENPDGNDAA